MRLFLLLIILLMSSPARADYHYASHQGSNEYPYTSWETAADSIQKAVDATNPHDTVYISAGDWYQYMQVDVYDSVAIIGMGMDSTFCHADSVHYGIFSIDYGCSVENIAFLDAQGGIYAEAYAGVTIKNCRFVNCLDGIGSAGGPSEISNCIFEHCGTAILLPVWLGNYRIANNLILNSYRTWAMLLQADTVLVENNIMINEPSSTISNVAGAPNYSLIRNNVAVYGTGGFGTGAKQKYSNIALNINRGQGSYGIGAGDRNTLFNNLLQDCYYGIEIIPEAETCFVNYNAFWRNGMDIQSWGVGIDSVGNISADPMLVSDDDFHLQAFSPLIDAGDPNVFDVDGTRSDIGAYGGPYGQSYDYQDLPPAVPDSLSGQVVADTVILTWRYNTEADFSNYFLYRDTVSGFTPSINNLIAEPESSIYLDIGIIPGQDYYYRLSSMDNQGNVSDFSEELGVLQTGIWNGMGAEPPTITTIENNYPNPFNSQTTIIYTVANLGPIPARIEIDIYDVMGRKVRTLVNERKEVGIHRVIWDGTNDGGEDCPSGIYFARIVQWDLGFLGRNQKLVLLR